MKSPQAQSATHSQGVTADSHGKPVMSCNVCPIDLSAGDYQVGGDLVRCGGCGRSFRPDHTRKLFCDHDCYSASLRVPIAARFWSKVNQTPTATGCWLWTAATIRGYGQIADYVNGKKRPVYAHRVSWELSCGEIPDGLSVLHRCDVPLCVNPAHLFLGTQADNLADARTKGRLVDGAHKRKLSDAAYAEILTQPFAVGSRAALARKFGVSTASISRIRAGQQGASTYRGQSALQPVSAEPHQTQRDGQIALQTTQVRDRLIPSPEIGTA